jgi:hypothetical protein
MCTAVGGLTPGKRYAVTVSALNERGQGKRAVATPALLITPPLTVPSPPTAVTVAVKTWGVTASPNDMLGDSQRLIVTYAPPLSNGGTAVTAYRVELDPTPTFDNPIVEDFDCPSRPDYSTWVVKTAAAVGDTIASGFFTLQLQHNGQTRVTNPIPYNAVALAVEESHNPTFVNDIFISPVTCVQDATATAGICPGSRQPISGSMQMRLNMLGILGDGVDVSVQQYNPADPNAYAWTITFLDMGDDFTLSVASDAGMVATFGGANPGQVAVTATHVGVGDAHSPCTGSMVVPSMATPSGSALVQGELYYARVTAYNRIGYSDSQAAAAPIKPAMVPGRPTSVTVNKYDATSLKVRTNCLLH